MKTGGGPILAGWFSLWKIMENPNFYKWMDDELGVPPHKLDTPMCLSI